MHTYIFWEVLFVAQQVFLKDKAWSETIAPFDMLYTRNREFRGHNFFFEWYDEKLKISVWK